MLVGRLSMHRDGYGFVVPEGDGLKERISGDIFINPQAVGPAMHGDRVLVESTTVATAYRFLNDAERKKVAEEKAKAAAKNLNRDTAPILARTRAELASLKTPWTAAAVHAALERVVAELGVGLGKVAQFLHVIGLEDPQAGLGGLRGDRLFDGSHVSAITLRSSGPEWQPRVLSKNPKNYGARNTCGMVRPRPAHQA